METEKQWSLGGMTLPAEVGVRVVGGGSGGKALLSASFSVAVRTHQYCEQSAMRKMQRYLFSMVEL